MPKPTKVWYCHPVVYIVDCFDCHNKHNTLTHAFYFLVRHVSAVCTSHHQVGITVQLKENVMRWRPPLHRLNVKNMQTVCCSL